MGRVPKGAVGCLIGSLAWIPSASATVSEGPREPVAWVIESGDYTGKIDGEVGRFEARYTIRVVRDGWVEIPLAIQGATVTAVEIEKKSGEAHLIPRGESYVLGAARKGAYRVRVACSTLLIQDHQLEGIQFGIPRATFSILTLSVPRKDVEVRQADQLYVSREIDALQGGVKLTARLGAADRIDLRWRMRPAEPAKVEPILYGEANTLVTVEEQLLRLTSVIEYRMVQGEARALRVTAPISVNILNVRGAGIEDWRASEADGRKLLVVSLAAPLRDSAYRLVIEAEQALDPADVEPRVPTLALVGVKQERGYVAIAREGSIELATRVVEGVNRIDVKELPPALRMMTGSPAVLAFKYHQQPYRVLLGLTRHQDHPVLAAIAERGELVTVLSQPGEVLTRATYLVLANKRQFLEVSLPEGATLWSCLVDGNSVKPVEGSRARLLVPLAAAADAAEAVSVSLVYFERQPALERVGRLTLRGPVLDVPTTVANWVVYAPRAVKFLRLGGNLERGTAPTEFFEEPFAEGDHIRRMAGVGGFSEPGWPAAREVVVEYAAQNSSVGESANRPSVASHADEMRPSGSERGRKGKRDPQPIEKVAMQTSEEDLQQIAEALGGGQQESGILPLTIRLPKSGTAHRFNRLMTTQEALTLEATFVHLRMPWVPFAALGLILLPVGGLTLSRFHAD